METFYSTGTEKWLQIRKTRQKMYVQCNTEARLLITVAVEKQSVLHTRLCVCMRTHMQACSLAYPACNACVPYRDIMCGPSGSTTFFDIIL